MISLVPFLKIFIDLASQHQPVQARLKIRQIDSVCGNCTACFRGKALLQEGVFNRACSGSPIPGLKRRSAFKVFIIPSNPDIGYCQIAICTIGIWVSAKP
jgi:hypothetical protein